MNQKICKLLSRYAKRNGFDRKEVKRQFNNLDSKSKLRLLESIKNLIK